MTDTTRYAAAVQQFYAARRDAMLLNDPSLSADGNVQRQREMLSKARVDLLAARPHLPSCGESSDAVLASMTPITADAIARMQHEQSKVRAYLDAGRSLSQIISDASSEQALAIADLVEMLPQVLAASDAAAIVAETRESVFDRLADLGVERAVKSRQIAQQNAPSVAWHRAMTETVESDSTSIAAWTNVYNADADGYRAVRDSFDAHGDLWAARLDATYMAVLSA
ncbi:hypothetical protein ACWPKO_22575 (plasmid) [Coraliomargarita sp. W4R53]